METTVAVGSSFWGSGSGGQYVNDGDGLKLLCGLQELYVCLPSPPAPQLSK